ncbi:hypothetical protein D3C81_2100130 [compost metagenome]
MTVGQTRGLQLHATIFAVDQAIGAVLHGTRCREQQLTVGGHGAAIAVVEAAGEQGQQRLARQLPTLVVDLARTLNQ